MTLLLLVALAVALVLARAVLGVMAVLLALGVLAIVFVVSLTILPWPVALAGWLVLGALIVFAGRKDAERALAHHADTRRRIRDFESHADNPSLPFESRVAFRRAAFDLRCELDDWEGFP